MKLALATVALIAALSGGLIAGVAVLSRGADAEPTETVRRTNAHTDATPVSAAAETLVEAKLSESAEADSLPPSDPTPIEPLKTGSISPAVPLAAMAAVASLAPESPPTPDVKSESAATTPEISDAPRAAAVPPRPVVSAAEASAQLARGEAALSNGDLAVARLFFARLAQAGDPRGALGMARTYDETELRKVPVYGLKPDPAEAERWRARARDMTADVAAR